MKSILEQHSFLSKMPIFNHKGIDLWRIICPKICGYNGGLLGRFKVLDKHFKGNFDNWKKAYADKVLGSADFIEDRLKKRWNNSNYYPLEIYIDRNGETVSWKELPDNPYIFLASYKNYLNPMIPVIEALCRRGEQVIILIHRGLHKPEVPEFLSEYENFKVCYLEDLYKSRTFKLASYQQKITAQLPKIKKSIAENLVAKGDLVSQYFGCIYDHVFTNFIPHSKCYIDLAWAIINQTKPKGLFIAMLRRSVENSFNDTFQKHNIPTYYLRHGIFSDIDNEGYYNAMGYLHADKIFVWDKSFKESLLRNKFEKVDKNKVICSGNPEFEKIVAKRENKEFLPRDTVLEKIGLNKGDRFILITEGFCKPDDLKNIIKAAGRKLKTVVKLHPCQVIADSGKDFLKLNRFKNAVILNSTEGFDLHSLIAHSEILLARHSTTMFEALACQVPVGVLKYVDSPTCMNIWKRYSCPEFKDLQSLKRFLKDPRGLCDLQSADKIYKTFKKDMATDCVQNIVACIA